MTTPHDFAPTDQTGGLVLATHLPGDPAELGDPGAGRLGWDALAPAPGGPPIWIHLDRMRDRAQRWIRGEAGLDPLVAESLLADETRPSFQTFGDGLLVILRGVDMNPGAEPDELIAIRMWFEPTRAITLRQFRFQTLVELRRRAQERRAPATSGGLLAAIATGLAARLGPSVQNLETMVDEIEDSMLEAPEDDHANRARLSVVRRQAISLRRYLVPQRDALRELALLPTDLLSTREHAEVRIAAEQVARVVDALEEIRDRAAVTQEEIRARHETRVGRTIYVLTIVASVALPLSLVTGLLGINVGGIPLADAPGGFVAVCAALVVIAVVEIVLLRVMRWI